MNTEANSHYLEKRIQVGDSVELVKLTKAKSRRASRACRPSPPHKETLWAATMAAGRVRAQMETKEGRVNSPASVVVPIQSHMGVTLSKGVSLYTPHEEDRDRLQHIASLKTKSLDRVSNDASWLSAGYNSRPCFDMMTENALRSNSVNGAQTQRLMTAGANLQTSRVNCKSIGQAAAAQMAHVLTTLSLAEAGLRADGYKVLQTVATNACDPCRVVLEGIQLTPDDVICVTSSKQLIYNSHPVKMGNPSIRHAAHTLAWYELHHNTISERVASSNDVLENVCKAICDPEQYGDVMDAVWASLVLITYLCNDPRGRCLLEKTGITDVDIQTVLTLEGYGRAEMIRRFRKRLVEEEEEEEDEKRNRRGLSIMDAHGIMEWWSKAGRPNEKANAVLKTLVSASDEASESAAMYLLDAQAQGTRLATHDVVVEMSKTNAKASRRALDPFFYHPDSFAPGIASILINRPGIASPSKALGVVRGPHPASHTTLHVCVVAKPCLAPRNGMLLLWSVACAPLNRTDACDGVVPGILERYAWLAHCKKGNGRQRDESSLHSFLCDSKRVGHTLPSRAVGLTRSVLSMRSVAHVTRHTLECADKFREEAEFHVSRLGRKPLVSSLLPVAIQSSHHSGTSGTSGTEVSRMCSKRTEPYVLPCSQLGVGIHINETLRHWMQGRTRKNDPCKVWLGPGTASSSQRDVPSVLDSEPIPMAVLTDVRLRLQGCPTNDECVEHGHFHVPGATELHVCLDSAVRTVDAIDAIDAIDASSVFQQRALLYVGSSQASYIGDVAASLGAASANEHINSSKKITVADTTTVAMLSIWDTLAGGLANVKCQFEGTPYQGTYGPLVDTGISPPGLMGHFYRSDKRQHGSMALSVDVANELVQDIAAHAVYVRTGSDSFVETPVQTRGIVHGFVPGVHRVLDDYTDALETIRRLANRHDIDTTKDVVDGLFALPFSAFTQNLAPDIECTADSTLRQCVRQHLHASPATGGRAYIPDATAEWEALLVEPLFRRPCKASVADNPWATSYEHMDGFFNALNALAKLCDVLPRLRRDSRGREPASSTPSQRVDMLFHLLSDFQADEDVMVEWSLPATLWAADACLLLFVALYPSTWNIGEELVPVVYSDAQIGAAQRVRREHGCNDGPACSVRSLLGPDARRSAVSTHWHAFARTLHKESAWPALRAMLVALLTNAGAHDLSLESRDRIRHALEDVVRNAWRVHSPDGVTPPLPPCPTTHTSARCTAPERVNRVHLDPVFVATGKRLDKPARGALVGLKPHQLRQLYVLMLGSDISQQPTNSERPFPCMRISVVRNEGGLSLRTSSAADVLECDGSERSDKSVSPSQTESDQACFGTRDAKLLGCARQRAAWDENTRALKPLLLAIGPPRPKDVRCRGEWGNPSAYKTFVERYKHDLNGALHPDEEFAQNLFMDASVSQHAESA
jgi:hypothetical protein